MSWYLDHECGPASLDVLTASSPSGCWPACRSGTWPPTPSTASSRSCTTIVGAIGDQLRRDIQTLQAELDRVLESLESASEPDD